MDKDRLIATVRETVVRESLLEKGDIVYVALSGGADSVALLHVLLALQVEFSLSEVCAVHVHHGIRGEFADRDERFVRELCDYLNVPLYVSHVDVPREVARTGESTEEAARRLRYAVFESLTQDKEHAKIATAHTASDQAETVLLHLIRGSGLRGAAGMPIKRGNIIRPLMDCSSQEVRAFCDEHDYAYVIDETNDDLSYARNRVRHEVLPSMTIINSQTERALCRFAQTSREEDAFLDTMARQLSEEAQLETDVYDAKTLLCAHPALCKRALFNMCYAEYEHIQFLFEALQKGGTVNLPGDVSAVCDGKTLRFVKRDRLKLTPTTEKVEVIPEVPLCFAGKHYYPCVISYKEYLEKSKIHKKLFNFCISYDMIETDLFLRSRMAGDSIRPFGRGCTKTLKKLMNDLQIPCEKRAMVPVLANHSDVLSLIGICVDESVAVTPDTEQVLWLRETDEFDA